MTAEDENNWARSMKSDDISQFKHQLNEYLESYTKGRARGIVDGCGEHNALDAWREFTKRGHSLRPTDINDLMKKVLWPRDSVPAKDLELALAKWESDIHSWESAAMDKVSAAHCNLALEEMCPDRLRAHLDILGPERLPTYEACEQKLQTGSPRSSASM